MNIVLNNYMDYLLTVNEKIDIKSIEALDQKQNTIVRKLCNLLSSCYAYTEHCSKYLHIIRPSPSFLSYKLQYIKNDGTAILEEIRNYAQHGGLPIHSITFNKTCVRILVYLDILRDSKKSNKELLESYPENIVELTTLLPNYIAHLYQLHSDIIQDLPRTMLKLYANMTSVIDEMILNNLTAKKRTLIC